MITLTLIELGSSADRHSTIFANGKLVLEGNEYDDRVMTLYRGMESLLNTLKLPYKTERVCLEPFKNSHYGDYDDYEVRDKESAFGYYTRIKLLFSKSPYNEVYVTNGDTIYLQNTKDNHDKFWNISLVGRQ